MGRIWKWEDGPSRRIWLVLQQRGGWVLVLPIASQSSHMGQSILQSYQQFPSIHILLGQCGRPHMAHPAGNYVRNNTIWGNRRSAGSDFGGPTTHESAAHPGVDVGHSERP